MTTLEVQRRLKALGYDPGPLDGIRGRLTIRAVKAFQSDRRLAVDGIVGPRTTAALVAALGPGRAPGPAPRPAPPPGGAGA
jgi:peptidoglycan hydrolase-like protein with peptidoglycan-binding domain